MTFFYQAITRASERLLLCRPYLAEDGQPWEPSPYWSHVQQLIDQPKWESALWGVHIVSLKDGKVLFSSNARKRFLPASNMKLLIGAAALDAFGAGFRFETPV